GIGSAVLQTPVLPATSRATMRRCTCVPTSFGAAQRCLPCPRSPDAIERQGPCGEAADSNSTGASARFLSCAFHWMFTKYWPDSTIVSICVNCTVGLVVSTSIHDSGACPAVGAAAGVRPLLATNAKPKRPSPGNCTSMGLLRWESSLPFCQLLP